MKPYFQQTCFDFLKTPNETLITECDYYEYKTLPGDDEPKYHQFSNMCQVWRHDDVITMLKLRNNSGFNDGNRKSLLDNLPLVGMYRAHYFNNCVLHSNNFNNSTNERKFDTGLVSKFFWKIKIALLREIFVTNIRLEGQMLTSNNNCRIW